MCSAANVEGKAEEFDIDADPDGWQPYSSFVDALREKIIRAEPTGKGLYFFSYILSLSISLLLLLFLCVISISCIVRVLAVS